MNDFERMARVIRYLEEHCQRQPSLAELAAAAGLSEGHFHRRFVEWVGVTPKSFQQCLTLSHARELLRGGESVLDSALNSGLSGPGRLHDLCLKLEAATPGEIKAGGRGLNIAWGIASSAFGQCFVASTPRGICQISFIEPGEQNAALYGLRKSWPNAALSRDDSAVEAIIATVFRPERRTAGNQTGLRAWVKGTAFQIRVWQALLAIPPGALSTYRRIGEALGQPGASRAVGSAIGANPVACLIPCHRVIRETGALGGYRWNLGRKRALLAWESARLQVSPDRPGDV